MKIKEKLRLAEYVLANIASKDPQITDTASYARGYWIAITAPSRVTFPERAAKVEKKIKESACESR